MKWYANFKNHLRQRHRTKQVIRAVTVSSRRLFPDTVPDWSLIAEDRPQECVVYQTYRPVGSSPALLLHRFFRVKLEDFSVTPLAPDYRPEKWDFFL